MVRCPCGGRCVKSEWNWVVSTGCSPMVLWLIRWLWHMIELWHLSTLKIQKTLVIAHRAIDVLTPFILPLIWQEAAHVLRLWVCQRTCREHEAPRVNAISQNLVAHLGKKTLPKIHYYAFIYVWIYLCVCKTVIIKENEDMIMREGGGGHGRGWRW